MSAVWDPLPARTRELEELLLVRVRAVATTLLLPDPVVLVSGLLRWRSLWECSTAADVGDTKAVAAECAAEEEDVVARRYVHTSPLSGRTAHQKGEC